MPRPIPTPIVHFTHVDHLATVVQHGLLADNAAVAAGLLSIEVGNRDIKERRRRRPVPIQPAGTIADYAPFYFAPRSPMMYAIHKGRVPEYADGIDPLLYLVSTVQRLTELGTEVICTDRNAVLDITQFSADPEDLDGLVDWRLMEATYWFNTVEEPDRRERRMAECLAHQVVPWEAFTELVVRTEAREEQALAMLDALEASIPTRVAADWYF